MTNAAIGLLVLSVPLIGILLLFLYDRGGRFSVRTLLVVATCFAILAAICSLIIQ
jgi:hypothetical protein